MTGGDPTGEGVMGRPRRRDATIRGPDGATSHGRHHLQGIAGFVTGVTVFPDGVGYASGVADVLSRPVAGQFRGRLL